MINLEKIGVIIKEKMIEGLIDFSDWSKLELRVGQIVKVEDIEGADKLYKLTIDVGEEIGERIVCAGLKEFYSKKDLKNKKIILFVNLTPRKMKGIESNGMILAACSDDDNKVVLIAPEDEIKIGSRVR